MKQRYIAFSLLFFACYLIVLSHSEAIYKVADLEPQLRKEVASFDGKAGVYIKDLTTGQEVSINGNELFPTASTNKVIVAMTTYKYLHQLPDDFQENVPELVSDLIIYSSNYAFDELVDELGSKLLAKASREMGLFETAIHSRPAFEKTGYHSVTTPKDMAKALEILLGGRYIKNQDSQYLLRLMTKGAYNEEIPRLLPGSTLVAHKPGELDNIVCDAGIVFNANRPYLISVYTKTDAGNGYASNFIANVSAITDSYFSGLSPRPLPNSLRRNLRELK